MLQKKALERHQNLYEEEKEKKRNILTKDLKTFPRMKNKG